MTASIEAPDDLHYGDWFRFVVVPAEKKSNWMPTVDPTGSFVQFKAYQNGELVYGQNAPASLDFMFCCGPSMLWTGGAAHGVGEVGHSSQRGKWVVDARCEFEIGA